MSTMLNGAAVMDAALLVIASTQKVPQPQTAEHLAAAEIIKVKNIAVVQSKLDLVIRDQAYCNYGEIKEFLKGTSVERAPVIPLSCTPKMKCNMDTLLQYLCERIALPERDLKSPPHFTIIRSFDVNHPGDDFHNLQGGVAGGTLRRGVLKVGQLIEIRPGIMTKNEDGSISCKPLLTTVRSLFAEKNSLEFATPGGLIAVGTSVDPALTKGDRLVGQVIGERGKLPEVYLELEISYFLMNRMIGLKEDRQEKTKKPQLKEQLLVNIGSCSTLAIAAKGKKKSLLKIILSMPCCAEIGEGVSLSRNVGGSWRLIGYGKIEGGEALKLVECQPNLRTSVNNNNDSL